MNELELPHFPELSQGVRKGRSPYEGYQRSLSLKFDEIPSKIRADADFLQALALALDRSVVLHSRLMNLYLLIRFFLPRLEFGHIIEFGSYRGGSAMFMAKLAQKYLPGVNVYALDTFAGMPATNNEVDAHNMGDFADSDLREVIAAKDRAGLDNLHVVQGLFDQTTPGVIRDCGTVALAHIDCDIYEPAIYAWSQVTPAMVAGGYIVFDDATEATCLGATEAVEDIVHQHGLRSEQIDPHFVFRYPPLPESHEGPPG